MDYAKYFKKYGWATMGRYYIQHPDKLKKVFQSAKKYASKEGLTKVKEEFLIICSYIRDVFTGKYKEYNVLNLIVIIGALVYVVTPLDAIPDFVPAGLLDDTAILLWATKEFADELGRYKLYMNAKKANPLNDFNTELTELDFVELPESKNSENEK